MHIRLDLWEGNCKPEVSKNKQQLFINISVSSNIQEKKLEKFKSKEIRKRNLYIGKSIAKWYTKFLYKISFFLTKPHFINIHLANTDGPQRDKEQVCTFLQIKKKLLLYWLQFQLEDSKQRKLLQENLDASTLYSSLSIIWIIYNLIKF